MKRRWFTLGSLFCLSACSDSAGELARPELDGASHADTPLHAGPLLPDASPAHPDAAVSVSATSDAGGGVAPNPLYSQCQFALWAKPEDTPKRYDCALSPSGSTCMCDGKRADSSGPSPGACIDVLGKVCGVDTSQRTHCEHGYGGGCWPSASGGDAWLCECAGTSAREVRAASCTAAGKSLCKPPATACESNIGRCHPGANDSYDCECPHDAPAIHAVPSSETCQVALDTACADARTQAGTGGPCMSAAGMCNGKGREPRDGFECQCQEGSLIVRQGKLLAPTCEQALQFYCAGAAPK
jgi:hypothetical protein